MEVTLYNLNKRINSTKLPTGSSISVNVNLKADTSMYQPTFLLTGVGTNYNYLKWDNRYYFITDVVKSTINNVWELICDLDKLGTLKSDILNTNAYVKYSSSVNNLMIIDERINFNRIDSIETYTTLFRNYASDVNTVIQYISRKSTNNLPTAYACVTNANMNNLCSVLMSNDFSDSLDKQLDSCASAIVGCKKYAFRPTINEADQILISLGNYDTNIPAWTLLSSVRETGGISVNYNTRYDDFRYKEPYTKWVLFLPGYGYIELPSEFMYYNHRTGNGTLDLEYAMDNVNGTITWNIDGIGKFDGVTAINIPVAYSGINAINTISSAMGIIGGGAATVAGIATGNPLAAIGGIGTIIGSSVSGYVAENSKIIGTQGANSGSMSSIIGGNPDSFSPILYRICLETDGNLSDINATMGRPYQKVISLSKLSGYVQTVNASVESNYPRDIINEVNSMLNGGIYIE